MRANYKYVDMTATPSRWENELLHVVFGAILDTPRKSWELVGLVLVVLVDYGRASLFAEHLMSLISVFTQLCFLDNVYLATPLQFA